MSKKQKKQRGFRFEESFLKDLAKAAALDDRNVNNYVEHHLGKIVKNHLATLKN